MEVMKKTILGALARFSERLPLMLVPMRYGIILTPPVSPISQMIGTYENPAFSYIRSALRPGGIFLDIGAHVGYYVVRCARLVKPKGKVIAFEPNPVNHRMLCLNVTLNRLENVIAIRSAVADFNGTAKLHIPCVKGIKLTDQGTLTHRAGQIIEVPAVMLDTALERMNIQPDVIKIDVEGSEREVVEGSLQTLGRGVQLVVIELHRSDARKHIIELLSNLDYAISEKGKFLFLRVRDSGSANRRDKAIG